MSERAARVPEGEVGGLRVVDWVEGGWGVGGGVVAEEWGVEGGRGVRGKAELGGAEGVCGVWEDKSGGGVESVEG